MASSSLKPATRKIINRWAKAGLYVYIRPLTSRYVDPGKDHNVYWSVSVEFRTVPPGHWDAEGYNLDDCIASLAERVPRIKRSPGWPHGRAGWLAPQSVLDQEIEEEKAKLKKKEERPRKRPKDKKKAKGRK